jgi:agmatine deiminase
VSTPKDAGFAFPAEWDPHQAVLLAWPSAVEFWGARLPAAQVEFAALAEAIADPDPDTGAVRGDPLWVLTNSPARKGEAAAALGGLSPTLLDVPHGDLWVRDTAPLVVRAADGRRACAVFRFNGWGGKFDLPDDVRLGGVLADLLRWPRFESPFVLEGGSVEVDGEGTVLTTEQCLLNENRNPGRSRAEIEQGVLQFLGAEKLLWLRRGLENDHTDGHIDTLARFVRPGVVVCMAPSSEDDPNRAVLEEIAADLAGMTDARGRRLEVVRVPSPGRLVGHDGKVMPASYVNFYISNSTVVVPQYGSPYDAAAVAAIGALFPGRRAVGVSGRAILEGGGAFHCITQQIPEGGA